MDLAAEHMARNRAADDRRGDVVQKARQDEYDDQKQHAAGPVVRQQPRHPVGQGAFLEVTGEQRKSHQQQEQIGEQRKFVAQVVSKTGKPGAVPKAGEDQFIGRDHAKAGQRNRQRVPVKQRDAQQRQGEEHKIQRNAEKQDRFWQCGLGYSEACGRYSYNMTAPPGRRRVPQPVLIHNRPVFTFSYFPASLAAIRARTRSRCMRKVYCMLAYLAGSCNSLAL